MSRITVLAAPMPATRMARCRRASDKARPLESTTAEAPSEIGAHMARVNGQAISGVASTSSMDMSFWYWASGFMVECAWFLAAALAICRCVVP